MANYQCTIRSNYFHVNNEAEFEAFMSRVHGAEDAVRMWKDKDKAGATVYGFGCHGTIFGFRDAEDEDEDHDECYDDFLCGLQQHIRPDDAIIILEAGHETLRYVVGSAIIITHNDIASLDMTRLATEKAADMLENENFQTKCDY